MSYNSLLYVLQYKDYWRFLGKSSSHGYTVRWADNYPSLKNGKIVPLEFCKNAIKKLSQKEAKNIYRTLIHKVVIGGIELSIYNPLLEVLESNFTLDVTNEDIFRWSTSNDISTFRYLVNTGKKSLCLQALLVKYSLVDKNADPVSILYHVMAYIKYDGNYTSNSPLSALAKCISEDKTISKRFIMSEEFLKYFNFMSKNHIQVYKMFIDHVFTKSVKLLSLLKLLKKGIPYECLTKLIRISNLNRDERWSLVEHVYVESFKRGDEYVILDNIDVILEHPEEISDIISWLLTADYMTVERTVNKIKTHTKVIFTQDHLNRASEDTSNKIPLIKLILENSNRKDVVVTRNIYEKVLGCGKTPYHIEMISNFLVFPGDEV